MPEAVVTVAEVKAFKTQAGNTRFVLRDDEGREFTTFREQIARDALAAEGRCARITFHEQQRGNFTNVYLDGVQPLEEAREDDSSEAVEEVAWKTAVDAAPWLLGGEPEEAVPPDELYELAAVQGARRRRHSRRGAGRRGLEQLALDPFGEQLRHRSLDLTERELLLLEHLAEADSDLLLTGRLRHAQERLVGRQLEVLGREGGHCVSEVGQDGSFGAAPGKLLVLGDKPSEGGALFRLRR